MKNMKLAASACAIAAVAALGIGVLPSAAMADTATSQLSASDQIKVQAELTKFGVTGEAAQSVLQKLRAGEALDADSGAAATGHRVVAADGAQWSVDTWNDGSYFATNIEGEATVNAAKESRHVSTKAIGKGISGCKAAAGVGTFPYKNCKVEYSGVNYKGNFRTDFTLSDNTKRWPASIQRADQANYYAVAGTVSSDGQSPPARVVRSKQSGATPAMAELTFLWNSTGSVGGSSVAIRLNVAGMNASVTAGK